jgi:nicotinate phosphoribosyltransferase
MSIIQKHTGLYTDHYELTMAQGYYFSGRKDTKASFDYFFRKNPYKGGFVVFAGLSDLLDMIINYRFDEEDCKYLKSIGFKDEFVDYLAEFQFTGDIYSVQEGEIVFPNEPLIRVEGDIIETQLIETFLLNIINFESLIATKAARMRIAAGDKQLVDFGLRRAQGLGSIHASRAAMIGGFDSSSNVFGAREYGFKSTGTMAHSWVQTFDNELDAFREFVKIHPENAVLLVDTYDTLQTGISNAITVAAELEKKGFRLMGVRLDSGDLAALSKSARQMLDDAGFSYIKIIASNQLDEYLIRSFLEQKAPIDAFGVGTALVTGKGEGALDGVYKLAQINNKPTMKLSENLAKTTLPGKKNLIRFRNASTGIFSFDGVELKSVIPGEFTPHPDHTHKLKSIDTMKLEEITKQVMDNGKRIMPEINLKKITSYGRTRLAMLSDESKRFENPHKYEVGLGNELGKLQKKLRRKYESFINS